MNDESFDAWTRQIASDVASIKEICNGLKRAVERLSGQFDDLSGGHNALQLRVDRLEQTEKRRTWTLRAIWTALIGLVANAVGRIFLKS